MRLNYLKSMFLLLIIPFFGIGQIQQSYVFSNGGQNLTSDNLSMVYSVGEPLISLNTSTAYKESQGFHQHDLSGYNSIVEVDNSSSQVYPNPASSYVLIRNDKDEIQNVELFDTQGKLILSKKNIQNKNLNLSLEGLLSGVYYVKIQTASKYYSKKLTVVR